MRTARCDCDQHLVAPRRQLASKRKPLEPLNDTASLVWALRLKTCVVSHTERHINEWESNDRRALCLTGALFLLLSSLFALWPDSAALVQGWGVLAGTQLPAGAHVCNYVGERVTNAEADKRLAEYDAQKIGHALLVRSALLWSVAKWAARNPSPVPARHGRSPACVSCSSGSL
jgi:hypothetical protein